MDIELAGRQLIKTGFKLAEVHRGDDTHLDLTYEKKLATGEHIILSIHQAAKFYNSEISCKGKILKWFGREKRVLKINAIGRADVAEKFPKLEGKLRAMWALINADVL